MRKTFRSIVVCAALFAGAMSTPVSACPMCKDSIGGDVAHDSTSGPSGGLPSGFNSSVYLMLLSFFGVLGLVGFNIYRGAQGPALRKPEPRDLKPLLQTSIAK